jgi:hypothetical protein
VSTVKVVKARSFYPKHPEYDVLVDGERIGGVRRRHSYNSGYFGCWASVGGRIWGATRKQVVDEMVAERLVKDS